MSSQNPQAAVQETPDHGSPAEALGVLGGHSQEQDLLNLRSEEYSRDAAWADHSWQ